MRVFVVNEYLDTEITDFCNEVVGVYTTLEKAQEKMKEHHNKFVENMCSSSDCRVIDNIIDDTQCLFIYKVYGTLNGIDYGFSNERYLISITEKNIED